LTRHARAFAPSPRADLALNSPPSQQAAEREAGGMRLITLALAGLVLFGAGPAASQSKTKPAGKTDPNALGIGFAQAEEGTWYCRGNNPADVLDCARAKCRAEAPGQDCLRVRWCYGRAYTGLMTVWFENFHTTEILCGAPDGNAVKRALAAFCAGKKNAKSCDIQLIIAPDGTEQPIKDMNFPGPR
jgi:hypothetical protein